MGLTTGQIIGSVGGAIIGSLGGFPGMMLGMSIGGLIGGWLDPPDAPDPPPLGDLGVNTYVHNAPVAIAYGQIKIYGGCIWIGEMGTEMEEGGSKKNPTYTPQMWVEFAIAHCEGPVQTPFLQYWINDKTVEEQEEGLKFKFDSYPGTDTQIVHSDIWRFLQFSDAPAVPFIHTSYTYVDAYYDGGYLNSIPNFAVELKALLTESGEEDANPIRVLYDFLTNIRYGACIETEWFDGDPDTPDTSWYIAAAYCDELVTVNENGTDVQEPRFRYSNYFDSRVKGYDIVKDILQSCRGIIAWSQGKIYVKIENENEAVSGYYSDEYPVGFTSTGSSTVDRVYVNETITEPAGFWEGTYLSFEIDGSTYTEMVNLQGADYFELVESLPVAPTNGLSITVTKDNIKEGSFNWNKVSEVNKYESVRIEFINRKFQDTTSGAITNEYQWDVVEWDSHTIYYPVSEFGRPERYDYAQQQVRLQGVKRKSQATRMAKWYSDFNIFVNYYCEFVTDVVGYMHKVGDIIGVSHQSLGWIAKEFRIVGMEEIENDEVKLYCLEYNRFIYGDVILPIFTTSTQVIPSVYTVPSDIERSHIVQDADDNKIYINFKRPDSENWWLGAEIWVKKGVNGSYEKTGQHSKVTSSVKLFTGGIDAVQTTVPFDDTTLYGAFPDSGEFWIEDELISYTSINDTLKQFEGCVRGSNASAHADTEYCHLKEVATPYITFDDFDIGTTWYIKLVSVTIVGVSSDINTATELSIVLS